MQNPYRHLGTLVLTLCLLGAPALFAQSSGPYPYISEFVADNSLLEDEDTDTPSWLELHNPTDSPVSLTGWYLTDREDDLKRWALPEGFIIEANAYRLIYASGKDRSPGPESVNTRPLHTNFEIASSGGYLALVEPDGETVASFYHYDKLAKDLAYGSRDGNTGYLFPATPAAGNPKAPSKNALTPEPVLSHPGGLISGPIELTITVPDAPEASIRYSLTDADPSLFTPAYSGPIEIKGNMTLRIQATQPGFLPSRMVTVGFLMMDESLTNFVGTGAVFDSNLPVIYLDSGGKNVDNQRAFQAGYGVVISPDSETGRASLLGPAEYAGLCAFHVRGESSSGFEQKSYALEFRDATGADLNASIVGMPAESDWALVGPWSEKTFMRNKLIYDWMRQLRGDDGTSVRTAFVELFFNQRTTDTVSYDDYKGIYLLAEKIKRDSSRVPLENLNDLTVDPDMITGGYIIRQDKPDALKNSWSSGMGIALQSFDPDRFNTEQLAYVKQYITSFETALRSDDFQHPTRGFRNYVDPDTFIDAQWMIEVAKQVDGYVFSTYYHKDRGGKLRAGPLWDFNISLGNADYGTGDRAQGWLYDNRNGEGQDWYPRMHADPDYHRAHWDRYWHMRQRFLSTAAVMAQIDTHMTTLLDGYSEPVGNREPDSVQNPVARQLRRWPRLGSRDWPNPPAETGIKTWQAEVDYMKDWIEDRLAWLDDQIVVDSKIYRAPIFNRYGGPVSKPFELTISRYKGTLFNATKYPDAPIYFTTDGSDPRLDDNTLNPSAQAYSEPISLERASTIKARMLNGTTWSPLTAASFLVDSEPASAANLVISELMYAPAEPSPLEIFNGFKDSSVFEYLELANIGNKTIDLTNVHFTKGITFDFATAPEDKRYLLPGEVGLLIANAAGFQRRYKGVDEALILGKYRGKLSNSGDRLKLLAADGTEIKDFSFNDKEPWPLEAAENGASLELKQAFSNPNHDDGTQWQASITGSPGTLPEGGDPGSGGFVGDPTKDSDNDGVADFIEFATGTDATNPSSYAHPEVRSVIYEVAGTAEPYLEIRYPKASEVSAEFAIEFSEDLKTWTADADAVTWVRSDPQANGATMEVFRSSVPQNAAAAISPRFLRLRVSQP